MKKMVAGILVTALALGAVYGAVNGIAAAISTGGVDDLGGCTSTVIDPIPTPTPGCTVE